MKTRNALKLLIFISFIPICKGCTDGNMPEITYIYENTTNKRITIFHYYTHNDGEENHKLQYFEILPSKSHILYVETSNCRPFAFESFDYERLEVSNGENKITQTPAEKNSLFSINMYELVYDKNRKTKYKYVFTDDFFAK